MRSVRFTFRWQTAAMAVAVLGTTACGRVADQGPVRALEPVEVETVAAARVMRVARVEAGGVVRALESATLASRVMAPVLAVHVVPGDRVRRGQLLVQLDEQLAASEVERAEAQVTSAERAGDAARATREAAAGALALATASHGRVAALHERRAATAQELDDAVGALTSARSHAAGAAARVDEAGAALASARAAAAAARTAAAYARIVAPFDGIVTEKLVEPGNLATPGLPLLRVDRGGPQRVDVYLDETRAAALTVGTAVTVVLPDMRLGEANRPPRVVDAAITEMARAIDVGTRSVLVKVALPRLDDVSSGTFARVQFPGESTSHVAVPASAIRRNGQVSSVFVVDGAIARLRLVRTGDQVEGLVSIDAGLDADERVVVSPSAQLSDGRAVRVTPSGGRS